MIEDTDMELKKSINLVCSFFFLVSFSIQISFVIGQKSQNRTIPVNVGVILDDPDSVRGKVRLSCIEMALSDFYSSHSSSRTRLVLSIRDSRKDVVDAAAAGLSLFLLFGFISSPNLFFYSMRLLESAF